MFDAFHFLSPSDGFANCIGDGKCKNSGDGQCLNCGAGTHWSCCGSTEAQSSWCLGDITLEQAERNKDALFKKSKAYMMVSSVPGFFLPCATKEDWSCPSCTLVNELTSEECSACGGKRPEGVENSAEHEPDDDSESSSDERPMSMAGGHEIVQTRGEFIILRLLSLSYSATAV